MDGQGSLDRVVPWLHVRTNAAAWENCLMEGDKEM